MDTKAFKAVFLPLSPTVRAVCRVFLKNGAEVDDAVQEVYLRLWEARMRLDELADPRAYAIGTARNYCLGLLRAAKCRPRPVPLEVEDIGLLSDVQGADGEMRLSEQIGRLRRWLDGVAEPHRAVFTMSHFGRYSNGEIAERLGLTEGNVRVILSRLRKEAKEVIGHEA
ncbi:RNA polymerase sigma factor [Porphyromonas loveana]|uniref:RNA polymerase sigma factor n=1 Tax=Porphyromonas loveana TaxID=1884669 RepID=UPI0035A0B45E